MNRFVKFWRDHIYNRCVDIELRLDLADAPYRTPAAENGLTFFVITDPQDVRLDTLARDFPRQSRTFRKDIQNGCVMLAVGDGVRVLGYFFAARRDFYDREEFRITFPAGNGRIYAFNFYVDPTYRNRPVARALLSEGYKWLRDTGELELYANVASTERALIRFYRGFQMLPTGRHLLSRRVFQYTFAKYVPADT